MHLPAFPEPLGLAALCATVAVFALVTGWSPAVQAAEIAELPEYDRDTMTCESDWLVVPPVQSAGVYRTANPNEIVLANGLVSRTFRLAPNGATVGFDNLMTGESVIRGVKPEAIVVINGRQYDVGGLKGQANLAFLRPEWVDALEADPGALRFVGFEIGETRERFPWKRVRHHAPDAAWPPPGAYLRMDYALSDEGALDAAGALASDVARSQLLADDFGGLSSDWAQHRSKAHDRSSFVNEGKVGEIYTPANTAVYVERALPVGTRLVEAVIDTGTDASASWGPGIALIWKDRVVKINLRPGETAKANGRTSVGVFDGQKELAPLHLEQQWDPSAPSMVRLRVEGHTVYCEVCPGKGVWETVATVAIPEDAPDPAAVRVGKLGLGGNGKDFDGEKGDLVRLHVLRFAAYGAADKDATLAAAKEARQMADLRVSVHYELYDGAPVMSKWVTVDNAGDAPISIDGITSEILAAVEYGSSVESRGIAAKFPNIHVETEQAFSGFTSANTTRFSVHWEPDPDYETQVNYQRKTPCMLEVRPDIGPAVSVEPGGVFESFHAFLMPYDGYDRERNGLAQRRLYRTIAPWVTENPLMMHVRYADWDAVKLAIDQCAEVGFEMVILTFGSGFQIEDDSDAYIEKMTKYADYARSNGIEIGGYSLLASRRINAENDVVMPEGQRPTFGNSPCLLSEWGVDYFRKLYNFYERTGFMLLEHDGSYPGDVCMSTKHPGHRGLDDSRWLQWRAISDFYKWCRGQGVYLNVPDYYYVAGSNKCGMGYRETNWSLPRAQQVIHTRQNIYDGTWEKTPSMGWMFVPLTQYHGGGAAATIEPLDEHRDHYRRMLDSNLALGVQACYRGPRLYDTDRTKAMVKRWVDWFKKYREILESDIIHDASRRADGRDLDWFFHANSGLKEKGMLVVYNPLDRATTK
ncbi:MAG: hypothetical protein GY851_32135, partial [bacterium]|nr:hypothetical protein [bacterium]